MIRQIQFFICSVVVRQVYKAFGRGMVKSVISRIPRQCKLEQDLFLFCFCCLVHEINGCLCSMSSFNIADVVVSNSCLCHQYHHRICQNEFSLSIGLSLGFQGLLVSLAFPLEAFRIKVQGHKSSKFFLSYKYWFPRLKCSTCTSGTLHLLRNYVMYYIICDVF